VTRSYEHDYRKVCLHSRALDGSIEAIDEKTTQRELGTPLDRVSRRGVIWGWCSDIKLYDRDGDALQLYKSIFNE